MDGMIRKSLKAKIILPSVFILSVLVVSLNVFLSIRFSSLNNGLLNEKLATNINSLHYYLDSNLTNTRTAAVSMSFNTNVIKAIQERDTDALLRTLAPMHEQYGVGYFTITDDEGIVLARTHENELLGDSLASLQNIQDALNGKTTSCFEAGVVVKVSARTGAPVYDADGSILGVVSAGVRLDVDSELEKLKELFESEVAIFFEDTRISTTVAKNGRSVVGDTLDPDITEIIVKQKQVYRSELDIYGEKYITYYEPIFNSRGEVFAVFFFGMPKTELTQASNNVSRDGVIYGFIGLIISILLIFFIMSSVSEPIILLSNDMSDIANGNLSVDIKIKGDDEVGHLGRSLQKVADILHKLLEDINIMINEHKKGNTDFDLETEAFRGSYKILADSVMELAAFSMRDKLTGMPNRRSFDNRMEMEWNRSIRSKEFISILLVDIDRFKIYNDTYGHPQGDVAIQTVAAVLIKALHRSTDFAARWGGEEFVVLLPDTDLTGALGVAEMIRLNVETKVIPCDEEQGRRSTVSIGVSSWKPNKNSSINEFVMTADEALYQAKNTGRNRICHHKAD